MAKEAVASDSRLQVEILKLLVNANDAPEAFYFAKLYNVSKEEWPWHLQNWASHTDSNCEIFFAQSLLSFVVKLIFAFLFCRC